MTDLDEVTRRTGGRSLLGLSEYQLAQQRAYLQTMFDVLGIVRYAIERREETKSTRIVVDFDDVALALDRAYGWEERVKRANVVWWQQAEERTRDAYMKMREPA